MFISQIKLNFDDKKALMQLANETYSWHQRVWQLFDDTGTRQRDFLYRLDQSKDGPLITTLSLREPVSKCGAWKIIPKPFAPKFTEGQRLNCMLRANAIVKTRDPEGKRHKHDVVMHRKRQLLAQGMSKEELPCRHEITQQAGEEWFKRVANDSGLTDVKVTVDGYQEQRFLKSKSRQCVTFRTLEFEGQVTVTSPATLLARLANGFGASKAFGCGLLLVRRAR